ncbi:hypothetical protein DFS34DRAFT_675750 [Phlyctochytrium arcticum]|nr:hypothetical protein DFS34DRAFT_675750 [Phlyctochytrium arcticum]
MYKVNAPLFTPHSNMSAADRLRALRDLKQSQEVYPCEDCKAKDVEIQSLRIKLKETEQNLDECLSLAESLSVVTDIMLLIQRRKCAFTRPEYTRMLPTIPVASAPIASQAIRKRTPLDEEPTQTRPNKTIKETRRPPTIPTKMGFFVDDATGIRMAQYPTLQSLAEAFGKAPSRMSQIFAIAGNNSTNVCECDQWTIRRVTPEEYLEQVVAKHTPTPSVSFDTFVTHK